LLDACLSAGTLHKEIAEILNAEDEEKLWQFYLARTSSFEPPEVPFEDWLKDIRRRSEPQKPIDVNKTIAESQEILASIKPPQRT
jgi:hypothetical protein